VIGFVKNGSHLIPLSRIDTVDYSRIEELRLVVHCGKVSHLIEGVDAIDAAMLLKPSCFEGKRLRWARNRWAVHNLVGHPLMQVLALLGLPKAALWVHDATVPRPEGRRGRR